MPNYLSVIVDCFPGTEAYTIGDPTNYSDIIWVSAPIAKSVLDASLCATNGPLIETNISYFKHLVSTIPDGSHVQWNETNQQWEFVIPPTHTPAVSVVSETGYGQASAVGTSANYARQDHSHGTPAVVTDATFEEEVEKSATPVLLDCWATWCGPCKMLAPTIEKLADELAGKIKVAKLDVDENPKTVMKLEIMSIPTLLVYKDGKIVDKMVGAQPKAEIEKHLANI